MARKNAKGHGPTEVTTDLPGVIDRLSKVVALAAVKGLQQKQQVEFLSHAGFSNTEVAEMVGTTAHTVNQTLHELRKGRESKRAAGKQVKTSP